MWRHQSQGQQGQPAAIETAHKVAWAAVKEQYHKEGDRWVKGKSRE
ncbi:MAG: ChaB family protein [Marinobacter adhaerens]